MSSSPPSSPHPQGRSFGDRPPYRSWLLAEWALLPLRLFIGATFLYAGLQKLSNPNFLNAASGNSIQAQLIASTRVSPVGSLLGHLLPYAKGIGIVIALAEVAVGVGTLLGLWGRVAAIGGAILSFTLFLTVSFHASPYFTGADIVFLFAWFPFIVAGSGTRLSLDAWIANRAARDNGLASPEVVAIPFAQVQMLCGFYDAGTCQAQNGAPCGPSACPVLIGQRAALPERKKVDAVDRRSLVVGGVVAAVVAGVAALFAGFTAETGRMIGNVKAAKNTTTGLNSAQASAGAASSTSAGTLIGNIKALPVGGSAVFTVPSSGDPGVVVRPTQTELLAYDAVCPHAGCTVGYYKASNLFVCPCHGSEFQVSTGDVVAGPAPHGLTKVTITQTSDGNLYAK